MPECEMRHGLIRLQARNWIIGQWRNRRCPTFAWKAPANAVREQENLRLRDLSSCWTSHFL